MYPLGFDGNDVIWHSSVSSEVTITDTIQGGKLGGWLDMRDEIIPKYKADLDELAKGTIWEINKIHSQGVGLSAFTTVTGTSSATGSDEAMGTSGSGLDFYDKITDGSFKLWIYDDTGGVASTTSIPIFSDTTTLDDLATTIGGIDANLAATVTDGKLQITASNDSTFSFSDDSSNVLAALGLNTFFKGSSAVEIAVNDKIIADKDYIAAAKINNNVGPAVGDSGNSSEGIITTGGPYTGTGDATYEIKITTDGSTFQWRKDGGDWSPDIVMAGSHALGGDGVEVTFNGSFDADDSYTINVLESADTYGDFAAGDNRNSLAVADLQYQGMTMKRWSYTRGGDPTSQDVADTTIEDYLHMFVSSIGIESKSIGREMEYKHTLQDNISQMRDNISSVSLDEEMANLIRYQHAYVAAAKLISVAEEMLDTLVNSTH